MSLSWVVFIARFRSVGICNLTNPVFFFSSLNFVLIFVNPVRNEAFDIYTLLRLAKSKHFYEPDRNLTAPSLSPVLYCYRVIGNPISSEDRTRRFNGRLRILHVCRTV
jgi:hypothetical protein